MQHQLECALLGLGQFQNTLDELHTWLSRTAEQLQGSQPISIDLQACEIELAKHKVSAGLIASMYGEAGGSDYELMELREFEGLRK